MPPKELDILTFNYWKFHIGIKNSSNVTLTKEMLQEWSKDPNKKLECIFCGINGTLEETFYSPTIIKVNLRGGKISRTILHCPGCKEYKGIQPLIPNFSEWK